MATTADIRAQLSNKDYPEARSAEARIVCLLLYMARQTRPDILASVTRKESRKGALGDWKEGTSLPEGEQRSGTVLSKDAGDVKLYESSGSDWAESLDDRRSTTGYSFHLQKAGLEISWCTNKQQTAAISTSDAENQAMAAAVQVALHLLKEMGVVNDGPIIIKMDNQS